MPTVVEGPLQGRRVVSVAAGWYHSMAVVETAEGGRELYTWGYGGFGQLGHGDHNNKLVPTRVAHQFIGAGRWAIAPEPEGVDIPSTDVSIINAERRQRVTVLEERVCETIQRLSGATAKDMPDDELSALREGAGAALRRFDFEIARRKCRELLTAELTADDASPFKFFLCPITLEVMEHPVVARDGHSYERSALMTHIAGRPTFQSPITNAEFPSEPLIPNNDLVSAIQNKLEDMARAEVEGAAPGARRRRRD